MAMEPNRKRWNDQQKELQDALARPGDGSQAKRIFLEHHAMVHTAAMSGSGLWSFADEVLEGLGEGDYRIIPPRMEHSIAWNLWHLARIEDVTMNRLVGGTAQLFEKDGWAKKLKTSVRETGNGLDPAGIAALSAEIDIPALLEYRRAVGRRTRETVQHLGPDDFKRKVDPQDIGLVLTDGAVLESTRWLTDYWGGKTIAGLLLMPPTRHCFVHLNEIAKLRQRIS
jgi:hypothetical protein